MDANSPPAGSMKSVFDDWDDEPPTPSRTTAFLSKLLPDKTPKNPPPDLQKALDLLELNGYDDLEKRLLSTLAFLVPWRSFCESFFLVQRSFPRLTPLDRIKKTDIPLFYTNYDEGYKRYDTRADTQSVDHTYDRSVHGIIDKSEWGMEQHEKLLYVWLLQNFKVGKSRNPLGFEYFCFKNICTAWEEVFGPIVKAVAQSYSSRGRKHDGRLASFVEAQIKFHQADGTAKFIPPPLKYNKEGHTLPIKSKKNLPKQVVDDFDKELRSTFPHHGQLGERPKYKKPVKEWLAEMKAKKEKERMEKARAEELAKTGGIARTPEETSQVLHDVGALSLTQTYTDTPRRSKSTIRFADPLPSRDSIESGTPSSPSPSPLKKYTAAGTPRPTRPGKVSARSAQRVPSTSPPSKSGATGIVPLGMFGFMSKSEKPKAGRSSIEINSPPRSPLHGVTRRVHIPDETPSLITRSRSDASRQTQYQPPGRQPRTGHRKSSSLRHSYSVNSVPNFRTVHDNNHSDHIFRHDWSNIDDDPEFSPMGPISAIPKPLFKDSGDKEEEQASQPILPPLPAPGKRIATVDQSRTPKKSSSEYGQSIPSNTPHESQASASKTSKKSRPRPPPIWTGALPAAPVDTLHRGHPIYDGSLRAALQYPDHPAFAGTSSSYPGKKEEPWPPKAIPWPGADELAAERPKTPKTPALKTPTTPRHQPIVIPSDWATRKEPAYNPYQDPMPEPKFKSAYNPYQNPMPESKFKSAQEFEMSTLPKQRQEQRRRQPEEALGARIVSLENIRGQLQDFSDGEENNECIDPDMPFKLVSGSGGSARRQLETYNQHMFPRKSQMNHPSVKQMLEEDPTRYERGGSYEREVLMKGKESQQTHPALKQVLEEEPDRYGRGGVYGREALMKGKGKGKAPQETHPSDRRMLEEDPERYQRGGTYEKEILMKGKGKGKEKKK